MAKQKIIKSSGNIFADLGFGPEEAMILGMRADLMATLRIHIETMGWTQAQAAEKLDVSQARISDLVRGKWGKFSLDMLVMLAAKAGLHPQLKMAA